jgi:hypothetical protein
MLTFRPRLGDPLRRLAPVRDELSEAPSPPRPRDNPSRGMPAAPPSGAPLGHYRATPGPPTTPIVKILGIDPRPARNGGILKAFVDVEIDGGWIIRSLRIVEQPGKFAQVLCPQISIKTPGRSPIFRTILTLPKAMKAALDFAVLVAWKQEMAGQEGADGWHGNE